MKFTPLIASVRHLYSFFTPSPLVPHKVFAAWLRVCALIENVLLWIPVVVLVIIYVVCHLILFSSYDCNYISPIWFKFSFIVCFHLCSGWAFSSTFIFWTWVCSAMFNLCSYVQFWWVNLRNVRCCLIPSTNPTKQVEIYYFLKIVLVVFISCSHTFIWDNVKVCQRMLSLLSEITLLNYYLSLLSDITLLNY